MRALLLFFPSLFYLEPLFVLKGRLSQNNTYTLDRGHLLDHFRVRHKCGIAGKTCLLWLDRKIPKIMITEHNKAGLK